MWKKKPQSKVSLNKLLISLIITSWAENENDFPMRYGHVMTRTGKCHGKKISTFKNKYIISSSGIALISNLYMLEVLAYYGRVRSKHLILELNIFSSALCSGYWWRHDNTLPGPVNCHVDSSHALDNLILTS